MEDFSKYNGEGTNLRKAQMCMLNILVEIDKVCRKHNIPYWLDSGTLIGAVRHGGFIPWDDDMDICVLRKDYPRLRKALIAELPPQYQLSDAQCDPYSFGNIGRVKDTHSYCNFPLFRKQKSQGLWVDILVQTPATPKWYKGLVEKLYGRVFRELHNISESRGLPRWHCIVNKTAAYILSPLAFSLAFIGDVWGKCRKGGELMHIWGEYPNSRRYMADIFPLKEASFEGKSFFVPHDTDAYLRKIYGDYMAIPDEAHRQVHMDTDSLRFF